MTPDLKTQADMKKLFNQVIQQRKDSIFEERLEIIEQKLGELNSKIDYLVKIAHGTSLRNSIESYKS